MSANSKKPELRFDGFDDAWEQRKLGDWLQTIPFKPFLKEPEHTGKYEIIQQGNVPVIGYANGNPCYDYRDVVIFGDHTLSLYKPKHPFFVATDGVRILKGLQNTDGLYLFVLLERYKPRSEGYKRYYGILADSECFITNNTVEQQRIGKFFDALDHLITLHQRKYEKLMNVKKSMLEKMFPKDGADVPEIRFAGFTDAWVQRKLGEVVRLNGRIGFRGYTEKDIIPKELGGVLAFSPTNIVDNQLTTNCKNTYITRFKYDESPEIKIHNGDILFVKTGSTLGKSALVTGLSEDATLNPQVIVMRVKSGEEKFFSTILTTLVILQQVNKAKIGGAVPTLTETKIKDFNVKVPKEKQEKIKIGYFFECIDTLIILHQHKLEKLKNIKKACLEKMFA